MTLPLQQIKLLLLRFSFPVPVHRAGGFLRILPLFHLEVVGNEIDQLGDDHQVAPEHQAFDSNLPCVIPVSGASLVYGGSLSVFPPDAVLLTNALPP